MGFDLASAKPASGGFDLSSAKPADEPAKQKAEPPKETSLIDAQLPILPGGGGMSLRDIGNLTAGGIRGAGSIGATLMWPIDKATDLIEGDRGPNVSGLVTGKQPISRNEERRQAMTNALGMLGAETDSTMFATGKLGGEVAGTAGAGGAIANTVARIPGAATAAPGLINALRTGGMTTGQTVAPGAINALRDIAIRSAGGGISGAASAGLVNPEDAKTGGVVGAALPPALKTAGWAGQKAGQLVRAAIPKALPEVAALAERAGQLGIDIPADRLVNSRPLNAAASSLNYIPLSGRAAVEDKMYGQFNKAIARTIGQDTDNMAQALRNASKDLGAQFDKVLTNNRVKVDPQFMTDLADAANKATNELGKDGASIIGKQVDDIINKAATGEIDGQAAYNIKKTLDRIGNRNSPEAYYARDLKKALMGALNRSLGPDEAAAFAKVRQQYGNMLDLEGLVPNGAEGGLSVGRLANMKGIGNKDLQELADIAGQFLKTRENAHGAAQRVVLGGVGATAAGMGAAPYVAGAMATGRGANALLKSQAMKNAVLGKPSAPNALQQLLENEDAALMAYRVAPAVAASR